jgi:hypothetical protein
MNDNHSESDAEEMQDANNELEPGVMRAPDEDEDPLTLILTRLTQLTQTVNLQQTTINNLVDRMNAQGQQQGTQQPPGNQAPPVIPPIAVPPAPAGGGHRQKEPGEIIKPPMPETFDGNPKRTIAFLTEMKAYFRYFPNTMLDPSVRVHVAGSRLSGAAKDWFEPHLRDFENNQPHRRKPFTVTLFSNYRHFEEQLIALFGQTNEKKEAESQLLKLRQTGSCSKYTATFIRISAKTDLEDASKKVLYYQGLKSEVKDELARDDLPDTFVTLSEKATRIDDRLYERRLERQEEKQTNNKSHQKNFYQGNNANQGKKRDLASSNDGKPGPMEWTANTLKEARKNVECYNCGEKGHIKKYCKKPKKEGNNGFTPVPEPKETKTANTMHNLNTIREHETEYNFEDEEEAIREAEEEELQKEANKWENRFEERNYGLGYTRAQLAEIKREKQHREAGKQVQEENENYDEGEQWEELEKQRQLLDMEETAARGIPDEDIQAYADDTKPIYFTSIDVRNAYDVVRLSPEDTFRDDDLILTDKCEETQVANCKLLLCKRHAIHKLAEWHEDHDPHDCEQQDDTSEYSEQPSDDDDPYEGYDAYDGIDDAMHNLNTLIGKKKLRELRIPGTLEGHPITVYIDSGATDSYIAPQLVNRLQLTNHQKKESYTLANLEKQPFTYNNGVIDRETDHLNIRFGEISDTFKFDITNIAGYDILLGYDWLESRNPDIDWMRGHVRWRTHARPADIETKL